MGKAYEEYIKREKISRDFSKEIANIIYKYFSDAVIEKEVRDYQEEANEKARNQYFSQALVHESKGEFDKALEFYLFAVELKHGEACYKAGEYYLYGKGVAVNHEKAFFYYSLSAKYLYFPANAKLASCYLYGIGTKIEVEKALDLLELGSFVDDEDCINMLADLYESGRFVEQDYELADYLRCKIIPEGIA